MLPLLKILDVGAQLLFHLWDHFALIGDLKIA
jgi:hypothetical protein